MKLHLPSALRKALLTCLAALVLPVALPTTLGTASGLAALVWLVSSQQATAVPVTWTDVDGTQQVECSGTEYWVKTDGSTGLGDLVLASSEGDVPTGETIGKFWTGTEGGLYNTLHVKTDSELQPNGYITCDWGNYFNLGGLIIDALSGADGQARELLIGRTSGEGMHIRFQTEDNSSVKVRIGSSTALYGSSVKLSSDGDWVIGADKTLTFKYLKAGASHPDNMADPQFLVAAGKTLTLSKNAQEGVGNFVTDLQVVSNGNISIGSGIQANFQNGATLNGVLTLGQGSQLTLSGQITLNGKLELAETANLVINGESTLTLGDGMTLNLLTDNTNYDDNWSFAWNVEGLDEAYLARLLAGATVNGGPIGGGKGLGLSEDGTKLVLVEVDEPSEPPSEFGPAVDGWIQSPGKVLGEGGEGENEVPRNLALTVTGGENGQPYSGGGPDDNVKISCGNCNAAPTLTGSITCKNLWLTKTVWLSENNRFPEFVMDSGFVLEAENIYVNDVGLTVDGGGANSNRDLGTTNLILGPNDKEWSGAYFELEYLRKFTLSLRNGGSLTTAGYLEIWRSEQEQPETGGEQGVQVVLDDAVLTVGELRGSGDIILSGTGKEGENADTTDRLRITGNSENFRGRIRFEKARHITTVVLSGGNTLTTAGITSTTARGGDGLGGRFAAEGEGEATVAVTGDNSEAALGVTFDEGVTLELREGARQVFGHYTKTVGTGEGTEVVVRTEISRLTGGGTLGVAGEVTVNALSNYTGEVHLYGNGTGGQAVLQLGGTVNTGGGTLSRVVLRQGGGELRLGQGKWGLRALGVEEAPAAATGGKTQLHIGAAEGTSGASLTLGAGEEGLVLGEGVELTLGGGIEYAGTIVVDAKKKPGEETGATGARLFDAEDAASLEKLTLRVLLDEGDFNTEWEGLQLFASGLKRRMKDALLGAIDVGEGGMDGLALDITDDGHLCFVREAVSLVWGATEGGVWEEGGATQWDVAGEGGGSTFQAGDTVIFGVVGGEGEQAVQVRGVVAPKAMTVDGAAYTFNAAEGGVDTAIDVGGDLIIEAGASATFNGGLSLSAGASQVRGELHLKTDGGLSLGSVEVAAGGGIYLESRGSVTAGNWDTDTAGGGTSISGEGKVVLSTDAVVDETNDLFTKLFAGGDAEVERDAGHEGIGTFEVGSGARLELGEVGKSVSLVRNLQVREGGTLVVKGSVFDTGYAGYRQVGTVVLAGSGKTAEGAEQGGGALVFETAGSTVFEWNVVLEGDAVIANGGEGNVSFAGQSEFDAAGHTVTLSGGAFRFGGGAGDGFHAAEGSSGTLALADGARLTVNLGQTASFAGYDIELGEGTTLTAQGDATFNDVGGTGSLVVEAGKTFTLVGSVRNKGTEGEPEPEKSAEIVLDSGAAMVIEGNGGTETSWFSTLRMINGDSTVTVTMGTETDYSESGVLRVDRVINNEKRLTLALDGIQNYIDAHRDKGEWDWTIQLFTGDAVGGLYDMWAAKDFLLKGVIGYDWQLDRTGKLSLTEIKDVYTWTDTAHGGVHRLTWKVGTVGNSEGLWDGGKTYRNGVTAELVGDTGEAVTVALSGEVEAKAVNISGSSEFTFKAADTGGSLHAVDMNVGADSIFNPEIMLERRMTVQGGKTATFTGGLTTANGSEVVLEGGATVKFVGDDILKGGARRKMRVTGSGNWDVDLSGASEQTYDGTGVTLTDGVKMRLTGIAGEENEWSNVTNLDVQGELELTAGEQVVFTGTNAVGVLRVVYSNSADVFSVNHLVVEGSGNTLSVTGEGDTDLGHVVLDIRGGTYTQTKGTLTVGGLRSNAQDGGTLRAQNLAITADDKWDIYDAANTGGQRGYTGNLEIAGNLTMNGKLWEEESGGEVDPGGDLGDGGGEVDPGGDLGNGGGEVNPGGDLGNGGGEVDPGGDVGGELGDAGGDLGNGGGEVDPGGDLGNGGGDLGDVGGDPGGEGGMEIDEDFVQHLDGEVSVGGAVMVQSGVLDVGGKRFDVVGQLSVSGGQFKWHGEEMTMGSLNITGDGAVELAIEEKEGAYVSGNVTVNGGIFGDGGKLSISGAPRDEVTGDEVEGVELTVTLKGEEQASYAGEVRLGEGGVLAVESTGQVFTQMSAASGNLTVGDGKNLVVGALNDAVTTTEMQAVRGGLKSVTLGAKANWTVQSGSFSLTGTLKWGSGASITLDCVGEGSVTNVLLGRDFEPEAPLDSSGNYDKLTFNLSADFLKSLTQTEDDETVTAHFLDNEREESLNGWEERFAEYFSVDAVDDPWNYPNLTLKEDGTLRWDVKSGATWTEGEEGVAGEWKDVRPSREWREVQDPSRGVASLEGINIYFTPEGAGADGKATLNVDGTVKPGSVYVEGGEYTLTQKEGTEGGLQVGGETGKGLLVVQEGAVLNLNLENTRLPLVVVEGTLGLGRAGALPDGTELRLNKEGVLRYTGADSAKDVSGMVSAKSSSTALHIEVSENVGGDGVIWGTAETDPGKNTGLKFALDNGTVKSGNGNLTLKWTDASADVATHAGKQEVRAGRLILEAGGKTVLSGEVVAEEGASLVLKATDALTYSGTATGGGALEVAQGAVTLSGNTTTGRVTLTGGTAILGSDGALGNENTVLTLSGGNIQAGSRNKVSAGSVEVVQGQETAITGGDVEIAGAVTGRGTLKVDGTAKGTLSGDVSGFMGTLDTGTSTWTLSKAGGETGARVAGQGRLVVNAKEAITLTGDVGTGEADRLTLQNSGSGDLVLATGRIGSGTQLQTSKGNIVLGNADHHIELGNGAADWAFGAITGESSVVLANVTLPHGDVFGKVAGGMKLVVSTATAPEATEGTPQAAAAETQGGSVDVAGMDAGRLDGITVNEHGLFTGATGEYTVTKDKGLGLHFTAENWAPGTDMSGLRYLISGQGAVGEGAPEAEPEPTFNIHQGNGDGLQLAFDASILTALLEDETSFSVRVLDGVTAAWDETTDGSALYNALQNSDDQVANALAMAWDGNSANGFTKDGLVLSVQVQNLYLVTASGGDKHESTSPLDLMSKKATVVLDGQVLTLNWAEDGVVRNLMGTKGAGLDIRRNTAETATDARLDVTFDNTYYQDVTDERGEGHLSPENWIAVKGQDTTFDGSVNGAEGVDITKEGLGTLTVGGNYTLADGTTRLERGRMVLSGAVNSMKVLEFAYTDTPDLGTVENNNDAEERGLVLNGGQTTLERVVDAGSVGSGAGVVLQGGAELVLSGASSLEYTVFTGGEGSGTITLESSENSGGTLALTGRAAVRGVAVRLKGRDTQLDVGSGENSLSALNGNGVLRGAPGGNLAVGGGEFSGTLDVTPGGSGTKGGKLTVVEGASFTLKNASSTAKDKADGWDADVKQGGKLTLDLTGKTANTPLVFGDVSVAGDLAMSLDASLGGAPVRGALTLTDTATFTVYGTGEIGDSFSLGFSTNMNLDLLREKLRLEGTAFVLDEIEDVTLSADGTIVIRTRLAKDTLEKKLAGVHGNAHAGFSMLLDALQKQTGAFANPTSYFSEMVLTMFDNIKKGEMAGVDRSLAAVAGSSISTLGSAVSQDLHRQLTSIRNRTTTMAAEVTPQSYAMLPLWHAWINGESDYHKLDADSFAPGFTLNSWGGTIGVDVDVAPHATVGLAVTAMYGDLKTEDAPDTADGSVDSVYVSAFLRATSGAWVHSLVLSAGAADISLDRTVGYGAYSYRTSGSTNGFSIGALYEVGYSRVINKSGTVAVQPVFNVELRHIGVDGYTETGSDGALRVDDMDQTVVTFGAGARMQAAMGTNAFNRTAIFESRLLVKADAGDRSGSATTGLKGSNASAEVESAEVGVLGVEAGAGISVPLGRNYGSLFLDGSLEFRDGWTSANATLGYRVSF